MVRATGPGLLAALVLPLVIVLVPARAAAFGTIDTGGQNREHERITRAAVACAAGPESGRACFEPRSADQLAGHGKRFGAVGSPDLTEPLDPAAHCDDADYLAGDYPRTRDRATASLPDCVDHLRGRFLEAVDEAGNLLDADGAIVPAAVTLDADCEFDAAQEKRSKCRSLEGFGRALHGVQDFYSHSNWTDEADPARPVGADNPPGLGLPAPSPVFDLRGTGAPSVPDGLSTGCFVLHDSVPGVEKCALRVTHAGLNKDLGLIDPNTGEATDPATPRGRVGGNFARAVAGAVEETRRQWRDLRSELEDRYGARKASLMVCALRRDDPVADCRIRGVPTVLAAGVLVGVVGLVLFGLRRQAVRGRRQAVRRRRAG
ncbi:hypothetical protein GCM10009558_088670 [Virgisporangium aurantiacum]